MDISSEILAQIVVYDKYARYLKDLSRRETWVEIVDRNKAMHLRKFPELSEEIEAAYRFVYAKQVLPSMRSMQFAGRPVELNNSRLYNCFSGNTEVVTANGVSTLEGLGEGAEVTVLTHTGSWKPALVQSYGTQDLYKIGIRRGRSTFSVEATKNHRWIKTDGSATTDLKVGDRLLAAPAIFNEFVYADASPIQRLYWAYGYIFGDGTCVRNAQGVPTYSMVRLCGKDKANYLDRFLELGFTSSTSASLNGDCMVYTGTYLKTVPDATKDSPDLIRAFVAGYLAADGAKVRSSTYKSKYNSIVATGKEHHYVVEKLFPIAGAWISLVKTLAGQLTNFGPRGDSKFYSISTDTTNQTNMMYTVESIEFLRKDTVWCLEVEDDASFVLPFGVCTGNCSFLPVDHPEAFSETMFLLLSGCGVGYSVQMHHVNKLPEIRRPTKSRRFLVGDSIEGWSDAVKVLMKAYFTGKPAPLFDFRDVRPKGAKLVTSGGRAPGPEPLRRGLHSIQLILDRKQTGEKLTTLEAHDIMCHLADAVLAGGIRRSAMIALFNIDDDAMLTCKYGNWYETDIQRALSNNSAVILRHKITKAAFEDFWTKIQASNSGEPGIFFTNDKEIGTNPCAEVALRANQFCNLTTMNAATIRTQEDLNSRAKAASFIATLQAAYTDFHYLREVWKTTTEKDALIGVSMTGVAAGSVLKLNLQEAAEIVKDENARVAKLLGINKAARTTVIKPEGTSSLALGSKEGPVSSGVHAYHNDYYIRRMKIMKNDPLYTYLSAQFPDLVEDDFFKSTTTAHIVLPQKAPEAAIIRTESSLDLLNRVLTIHQGWIRPGHRKGSNTNNVSTTVNMQQHEWKVVGDWMWENRDHYTALAILPMDGHTYVQTPFEDITKERYHELCESLHRIDLSQVIEDDDGTLLQMNLACAGGACDLV